MTSISKNGEKLKELNNKIFALMQNGNSFIRVNLFGNTDNFLINSSDLTTFQDLLDFLEESKGVPIDDYYYQIFFNGKGYSDDDPIPAEVMCQNESTENDVIAILARDIFPEPAGILNYFEQRNISWNNISSNHRSDIYLNMITKKIGTINVQEAEQQNLFITLWRERKALIKDLIYLAQSSTKAFICFRNILKNLDPPTSPPKFQVLSRKTEENKLLVTFYKKNGSLNLQTTMKLEMNQKKISTICLNSRERNITKIKLISSGHSLQNLSGFSLILKSPKTLDTLSQKITFQFPTFSSSPIKMSLTVTRQYFFQTISTKLFKFYMEFQQQHQISQI